ncbi:MAG: MFS transporter [Cryobacterium sp.]|nr:MFS transporter [Oligoflexia bacterium]
MNRSQLLPISLIVAVDVLGLTLVIPLLPFYAEKYGASPSVVGLLVSAYAFFQLVSGPILGQLSDRYGRKPILIISQIGTFLGFILLARASMLWMIFLSRIIDGATAGNLSVAQAYIADVTKPEDRAKSFAIIGIAFGLGFLVGPAASGYLAHYGIHYPIYAAAGLSLLSIILTVLILREPAKHADEVEERKLGLFEILSYRKDFQNPKIKSTLYQFCAFFMAFSIFIAGFALFAERRFLSGGHPFGPREVGYLFAYSGFLGILIQGGLVGRIVKKFGEDRVVVFSFVCATIGYSILAYAHTVPIVMLSATFSAFGGGVLRPALTSLISRQSPASQQGRVMGLIQSLNSVSSILGPILSGLLIDRAWFHAWAFSMALASVAGLTINLRTRHLRNRSETAFAIVD